MRNYINEYTNESGVTDSLNALSLTKPYLALLSDSGTIDWNTKSVDFSQVPLTIEFLSGGTLDIDKSNSQQSIIYMQFKRIVSDFPDSEWQTISTQGNPKKYIIVKAGDIIQFKGTNDTYCDGTHYNYFSTQVNNVVTPIPVKIYGNIMSLIYGDNFVNQTSFPTGTTHNLYSIFYHLQGITDASNLILPATTLTPYCYSNMFAGFSSLTQAPVLPATTLAEGCYAGMFYGCTSLTTAPELPAPTLVQYCYGGVVGYYNYGMFYNCTNLNYVKCLATDISANGCTVKWMNGVQTNSGTFVKKAGVNWETGINGIPDNWTVIEE